MTAARLFRALPLGCCLLASISHAQLPPSAQLGRLFSNPGERSLLDSKRSSAPAAPLPGSNNQARDNTLPGDIAFSGGPAPEAPGAPAGPAPVTYNGLVRASNGHTTVWLDGAPASKGAASHKGKAVALRLSSGRQLIMQPGQSYDALSGKVSEGPPVAPPAAPAAPPAAAASPELPPPDTRQ